MSFSTLGLDSSLLDNLKGLGYTLPTPVQREAIPAVLATEVTLEITKGDGNNEEGFYNVVQRTTIGQIAEAGKRNEPDLYFLKMKKGTVKFYNVSKGFGFIKDNDTNEEIFVHASGLVDQVKDGDTVTYDVTEGKKGMNAVNVKRSS